MAQQIGLMSSNFFFKNDPTISFYLNKLYQKTKKKSPGEHLLLNCRNFFESLNNQSPRTLSNALGKRQSTGEI